MLEADLANLNAILHPPGMVCNAGWIEATAGKFGFYADGGGPAVARVMDAIDAERLALACALGVRAVPFAEQFRQLGFTAGEQVRAGGAYHAIQHSELIRPIQSPPKLDHRYLHEDVGWGLVPWMHLAAAAGHAGAHDHRSDPPGRDDQRHRLPARRAHPPADGTNRKDPRRNPRPRRRARRRTSRRARHQIEAGPGLPTPRRKRPIRTGGLGCDNPGLDAMCPAPLIGAGTPPAEELSRAPYLHHRLHRRTRPRRRRCPHQ